MRTVRSGSSESYFVELVDSVILHARRLTTEHICRNTVTYCMQVQLPLSAVSGVD